MYAEKSRDTNCVIRKVSKLKRKYVKHGKMEFYCYFLYEKVKSLREVEQAMISLQGMAEL